MNKPLISIIVPVYNVEQYLRQCIESIIRQIYKNLEIILIDDGSTDNSGKICDEYALKDDRIIIIHKQNGGVSSARNAGLKIAKGDYIGFVDGDDYIRNDMYEELYNTAIKTNTELVVCNYLKGNENNWITNNVFPLQQILTIKEAFQYLYKCESIYTKMFKKNIINNIFFDENIVYGEDRLFYIEAYKKIDKIGCLPSAKYFYRTNPNSSTQCRKFKREFIGFIDVLNLEMDYADKNNLIDLKKRLYKTQLNTVTAWLGFIALDNNPDIYSANMLLKYIKKNLFNFLKSNSKFSKKFFILITCVNFNLASLIYKLLFKLKVIKREK